MIQSDHGCVDQVRVKSSRARDPAWEDDRPLTEGDGCNIAMVCNRLGYQIDRIGVVEQPGTRTDCLHVRDDTLHDMDRAQRHKETARPLGLLADDAMLEWDRFIQITCLKAARTKAGQHRVTILQSGAPISRIAHYQVNSMIPGHLIGKGLHQWKI